GLNAAAEGQQTVFFAVQGDRPGSQPILTNTKPLLVTSLPVLTNAQTAANHSRTQAITIPAPGIVNGRFLPVGGKPGSPGDYYAFHADAGKRLIFQAQCAAIDSPADPILTLYDKAGNQIEENDDSEGRDSRIDRTFEKAGDYVLRIKEVQGRTGEDRIYRLVISEGP